MVRDGPDAEVKLVIQQRQIDSKFVGIISRLLESDRLYQFYLNMDELVRTPMAVALHVAKLALFIQTIFGIAPVNAGFPAVGLYF